MILSSLPLLLMPVLIALFVKAAAFMFRRTQLRWLHALVFGLLQLLVTVSYAVLKLAGPPLLATFFPFLGLVVQLLLGGWYFGPRAKTTEGVALQFKGGVLLSLIAYALLLTVGTIGGVALPMLLQASRH